MNRVVTCAAGLLMVLALGYVLVIGRGILIPLVVALFIWNILNTLNHAISRIPKLGHRLPFALTMTLSFLVIIVLIGLVFSIIANNLDDVIGASSRYQESLKRMVAHIDQRDLTKLLSGFDQLLNTMNIQGILLSLYGVFTTLASSAVLIALYVVFLFVEQQDFTYKLSQLFPQARHRELIHTVLTQVANDIQAYLGLKTVMGLMTAVSSWIIMEWIGLDFAAFWALLIFFLNYIPNIGAIVATLFPAAIALIQFQDAWMFTLMTSGLVVVQFVIGNLIEPRYLSRSLNVSPLVILVALAVWGSIWGILGMFLSVPMTVMMMIVFAQFPSTRPVAILLSQNGLIQKK